MGPVVGRRRSSVRGDAGASQAVSGADRGKIAQQRDAVVPKRVRVASGITAGGQLQVDWRDDGVWLTGPVARVFDGWLPSDLLAAHA